MPADARDWVTAEQEKKVVEHKDTTRAEAKLF
jgi:hypothetical protein